MPKPTNELDASKVSLARLDRMKLERAEHVLTVVVKLCKEAKRTDGARIINTVTEDMEQLLLIGGEIARREDQNLKKSIDKELKHDNPTR